MEIKIGQETSIKGVGFYVWAFGLELVAMV
jgi:hypothetical protein